MKKILSTLILASFLLVLLAPLSSFAQTVTAPNSCTMKRAITIDSTVCGAADVVSLTGDKAICCLLNTVYNVTDYVFIALVVLCALFIIMGAAFIVTAQGNPENVEKGRKYILYAVIGLVVAILAKAVPSIVKLIAGTT